MKSLRPVCLFVLLPAVLLWLAPETRGALLYDRPALLHGEWWRLWTGHWVHFSVSHLAWNLAVLLGAGAGLEHLRPGALLRYLPAAAPLISLVLLVGEPAMQSYGGLSGLATGAVVLLALVRLGQNRAGRAWWIGVLALVAGKIAFEAVHPAPLFSRFATPTVRSSVLAHAAGAATALALFLSPPTRSCLPQKRSRRPTFPTSSVS